MSNMASNEKSNTETTEKKKLSTKELVKQQLERKKQANNHTNPINNGRGATQRMKSQQTKKPSNTRRKMGS